MMSLACNFPSRCSATCIACLLAAVRIAVLWQTTALQPDCCSTQAECCAVARAGAPAEEQLLRSKTVQVLS